jgi:hypothetical protein
MKILRAAVSGALMLGLLLIGNSAKCAEGVPGTEEGWYQCTSAVQKEAQTTQNIPSAKADVQQSQPIVVAKEIRSNLNTPKSTTYSVASQGNVNIQEIPRKKIVKRNYYCQESGAFRDEVVETSVFHQDRNVDPREGGRYWLNTTLNPRDSYSVKRPEAKMVKSFKGHIPSSMQKIGKGSAWGVLAVNPDSGEFVWGQLIPTGKVEAGKIPVTAVLQKPVDSNQKWYVVTSDRAYNNAVGGEKRGETIVTNFNGDFYTKLRGGMFLERDPHYMGQVALTYGTPLNNLVHADINNTWQTDGVFKQAGWNKFEHARKKEIRYTNLDRATFVKIYTLPDRRRGYVRFADDGGLTINPDPIGMGISVGSALLTSTFIRSHNTPCLSTKKNGVDLFEQDFRRQRQGTEYRQVCETAKSGKLSAQGNKATPGLTSYSEFMVGISSASSPGDQLYDAPSFWLTPKRVEAPVGGGMGLSPNLTTRYGFANWASRVFVHELSDNAVMAWGPAYKAGWYSYKTSSNFKGRGESRSFGIWPELVTRQEWGGTDTTIGLLYGGRSERGDFNFKSKRSYGTIDMSQDIWFKGIQLGEEGRHGSLFSGLKLGLLWETDGYFNISPKVVVWRGPYDIANVAIGPGLMRFRHGPMGGGVEIQAQVFDGIYLKYGRYFGKRSFPMGSVDLYRVYAKLEQLDAEWSIKECPWDKPPQTVEPAVAVPCTAPAPKAAPQITIAPPAPEIQCEKTVKVKKKKVLKKRAKRTAPSCAPKR